MLGLGLCLLNWELSFKDRYELADNNDLEEFSGEMTRNFLESVIMATSFLAIFALFLREFCAAVWFEYRSPLQFSRHLEKFARTDRGELDNESFCKSETYKHFCTMFKSRSLWVDLFILMLMPYPTMNVYVPSSFYTTTINWVDNSGVYAAHTHKYQTLYFTSDLMLALMFSRLLIFYGALV